MSEPVALGGQDRLRIIAALLTGREITVKTRLTSNEPAFLRFGAGDAFVPEDEDAALALLVAVRELVGDHLAMRVIAMSDIENRLGRSLGGNEKAAVSASGGWRTFHYLGPNTGLEIGRILDSCGIR